MQASPSARSQFSVGLELGVQKDWKFEARQHAGHAGDGEGDASHSTAPTAVTLPEDVDVLDVDVVADGQPNLSLDCCGTAKVEALAAASSVRGGGFRPFVNVFPEAA